MVVAVGETVAVVFEMVLVLMVMVVMVIDESFIRDEKT